MKPLAIVGPTAGCKSQCALNLSNEIDIEIILLGADVLTDSLTFAAKEHKEAQSANSIFPVRRAYADSRERSLR